MGKKSGAFRFISPLQLAWISGGGIVVLLLMAVGVAPLVLAVAAMAWALVTIAIGLRLRRNLKAARR